MRIVGFLSRDLLAHFMVAIGDMHAVQAASDPVELLTLIRSTDAEILVVDPTIRDGLYADAIESMIACNRQLSVVAYTTLTPAAMGSVLRLARVGVQHVVLHRVDDDRQSFLALIDRIPEHFVSDLMLHQLSASLLLLPDGLRRVIEQLFRSTGRVRTTSELAIMAGMTRRSLSRHMTMASLQPRHLITCARLVRAYTLLRMPGSRLKEISGKLGYPKPQTLSDLFLMWTGFTSKGVRESVPPEMFVQLVAERLRRSKSDDVSLQANSRQE